MGGIAALVVWDGRPLARGALSPILAASAHCGSDGASVRTIEGASLGHQRFVTTPEQSFETQPLVDDERATAFVFDGRIDNRGDLARELNLADASMLEDARMAFEAYLRWGADAASHLLGDFAFVAWDWRERRLTAARDHMGVRTLHFCTLPDAFVCATEIAQVLAHEGVPRDPDLVAAADYLACDVQNGPRTLFRGISRVPPGHVLTARASAARLDRYWAPEPGRPISYRSDEQYASHCRELLMASVDARLRSDRPPAVMLSGGLDSSSVVTVAHCLLTPRKRPQPFSLIFPDHPEADERPFISAVERSCGIDSVRVQPAPVTVATLDGQVTAWQETPALPADAAARSLYDEMTARGYRVALTGAAGDFLFSGSVFQYADLLRSGKPRQAIRRFLDDRRAEDTGVTPFALVRAGIWPLLPIAVKRALRPVARRVARVSDTPPWLRLRREGIERPPDLPRGGSFASEDVTRRIASGMQTYFIECGDRAALMAGVELRHPFLDRRLVQFALDIPDDQRRRGVFPKFVLRQALDGHLAEDVRQRLTKAAFGYCVVEALDALGGEPFFRDLAIADAGWVDATMLARTFARMRRSYAAGDDDYGRDIPALWMVAAVELWFRNTFVSSIASVRPGVQGV